MHRLYLLICTSLPFTTTKKSGKMKLFADEKKEITLGFPLKNLKLQALYRKPYD